MANRKAPYSLLYEDEDILVVYKERDVFSIRTKAKNTFSHNLYHYLREYLLKKGESLFIVHRLDYETSGILIFAKKRNIQILLQKAFEEHQVERLYEAVILERIPLGSKYHVDQYLKDISYRSVICNKDEGKEAITDILATNYIQIGTALDIRIETGRHNQIRVALASLGFTLLGDKRYSHNENKRLYLNAYSLSFPSSLPLKRFSFSLSPLWLERKKEAL